MTYASKIQTGRETVFRIRLTQGELIDLPRIPIQTEFVEGEDEGLGGPTVREALARANAYRDEEKFIQANVDRCPAVGYECVGVRYGKFYLYNEIDRGYYSRLGIPTTRLLNEDDRAIIRQGEKLQREDIENRARRWFKRYGATHIKTGTYWMSA